MATSKKTEPLLLSLPSIRLLDQIKLNTGCGGECLFRRRELSSQTLVLEEQNLIRPQGMKCGCCEDWQLTPTGKRIHTANKKRIQTIQKEQAKAREAARWAEKQI